MSASAKLSAERFQQIIATLKSDTKQTKGSEKRTEGRVGLRCQLDLIARKSDRGNPLTVWVRDISVNGIGFVTATKIERGTELVASFARWNLPPLAIVYRVTYTRQISGDLYSIGGRLKQVVEESPVPKAA